MQLTPEDLARLQTKEVANAIRKLHAGKTLTAAERALIAAASADSMIDPTGYVGTWDELAQRLDVSRRAIQEWRHDPRYKPEIEKRRDRLSRADGRHCVAEWLRFMVDFHLKRGAASADVGIDPETPGDDEGQGIIKPPPVGGSQSDWQKAILHEKHAQARNDRLTIEGTLLVAAELEVPLGATLAAIQTKLSQYPARAARRAAGLRDIGEVEDVLRDEMDADIADIHAADYIETAVPEVLAALPFDEESTRLLKLVTFDGQDANALRELIARVSIEALRLIGRRAIAALGKEPPAVDSEVASAADEDSPRIPERLAASPAEQDSRTANNAPKDRRRKSRVKPATPPPEVEAAIVKAPRRSPPARKRRAARRRQP